jgi:hypothetical protein
MLVTNNTYLSMNTIEFHGIRIYFKMTVTFLFLFLSNVQVMRY